MSLTNVKGASQRLYIIAAIVGVVVLGGILLSGEGGGLNIFNTQLGSQSESAASQQTGSSQEDSSGDEGTKMTTTETVDVEVVKSTEHIIEVSNTGFSPKSITIAKGDTVTFVSTVGTHWPASAIHPTHTVYPGSSINKCDTDERSEIFDACEGIVEGDSWSFTFDEVGTWNYHDHLTPSNFGSVTVQ